VTNISSGLSHSVASFGRPNIEKNNHGPGRRAGELCGACRAAATRSPRRRAPAGRTHRRSHRRLVPPPDCRGGNYPGTAAQMAQALVAAPTGSARWRRASSWGWPCPRAYRGPGSARAASAPRAAPASGRRGSWRHCWRGCRLNSGCAPNGRTASANRAFTIQTRTTS
jgi:hypothetical protein